MSLFTNFQPLKPEEVNNPLELVSLDTADITMPLGSIEYIALKIEHFTLMD